MKRVSLLKEAEVIIGNSLPDFVRGSGRRISIATTLVDHVLKSTVSDVGPWNSPQLLRILSNVGLYRTHPRTNWAKSIHTGVCLTLGALLDIRRELNVVPNVGLASLIVVQSF